jgi:hypothetical protein
MPTPLIFRALSFISAAFIVDAALQLQIQRKLELSPTIRGLNLTTEEGCLKRDAHGCSQIHLLWNGNYTTHVAISTQPITSAYKLQFGAKLGFLGDYSYACAPCGAPCAFEFRVPLVYSKKLSFEVPPCPITSSSFSFPLVLQEKSPGKSPISKGVPLKAWAKLVSPDGETLVHLRADVNEATVKAAPSPPPRAAEKAAAAAAGARAKEEAAEQRARRDAEAALAAAKARAAAAAGRTAAEARAKDAAAAKAAAEEAAPLPPAEEAAAVSQQPPSPTRAAKEFASGHASRKESRSKSRSERRSARYASAREREREAEL